MLAKGEFEVDLRPLEPLSVGKAGVILGRMSMAKTFSGDLSGSSQGEMLSAGGIAEGSAGYVAIEQVDGTLHGKAGTFVLQHFATMNRGEPRLILEVVPDSGTGELQGIAGAMAPIIEDGRHFYEFVYSLDNER